MRCIQFNGKWRISNGFPNQWEMYLVVHQMILETGYSNVLGEMVYLDNERSAEWLSKVKRAILKSSMCDLSSGHFCDS